MNINANNIFQLQGYNPHIATLGVMGDMSNLCQFVWYEWVYFRHKTADFPFQKEELGRCLGPTKNDGNEMCQWVLQKNGQVFPRQTPITLRSEELTVNNQTEYNKGTDFDSDIKESLGDYISPAPLKPAKESFDPTNNFDYDEDDEQAFANIVPKADDSGKKW